MKTNKKIIKNRHWIALAFAVAVMVVAIISFADFSGEPAPKWRQVFMTAGPVLMVALLALNIALDRRDGGGE